MAPRSAITLLHPKSQMLGNRHEGLHETTTRLHAETCELVALPREAALTASWTGMATDTAEARPWNGYGLDGTGDGGPPQQNGRASAAARMATQMQALRRAEASLFDSRTSRVRHVGESPSGSSCHAGTSGGGRPSTPSSTRSGGTPRQPPWRKYRAPAGMAQCGWTYISIDNMLLTLEASLRVNVARFGKVTLRHGGGEGGRSLSGPPQRPRSRAPLGPPRSHMEAVRPVASAQFAALGRAAEIDYAIAQVRYVDDVISVSPVLCATCITKYVEEGRPGIPFGLEENAADAPARLLDVTVRGDRLPLHLSIARPEMTWIADAAPTPKAFRVAPYLGMKLLDRDHMRGHARSRMTRWCLVRMNRRELLAAITHELAMMVRAGYPQKLVAYIWAENFKDYKESMLVRAMRHRFAEWPLDPTTPGCDPSGAARRVGV